MKMRAGFTILELLLAIAISVIVSGILFAAFGGINRIVRFVDNTVDIYTRATIALHQCERDLVGAFAPSQEKLTHIFFGTKKDDNLDILTFITTDPVPTYWTGAAGNPKPRLARIVYRLELDTQRMSKRGAPTFRLMRQESPNLDFAAFKNEGAQAIRAVELIRDIKRMKVMYTAEVIKNSTVGPTKEGPASAVKGPVERSYVELSDWNREAKTADGKEENPPFNDVPSKIPRVVNIELVLWDAQHKRDRAVTMTMLIPTDSVILISEKKQEQMKTDAASAIKAAFGEGVELMPDSQGIMRIASTMEVP